jgi:hypothetical protein
MLHILVHVFGEEGNLWAHQDVDVEQNIKQNVDTHLHLLERKLTFYAVTVESHVPVGQVVQELHQFGHDCVELVFVHLFPGAFDQIVQTTLNPFVSQVESLIELGDVTVENKSLIGFRLEF